MAVVIRMKRTGRKNRPCYRISVAESARPCDGRTLDTLGIYDPVSPVVEKQVTLDVEKAKEWLSRGALPSETVKSIFQRHGVYEGAPEPKKRDRSGRAKDTKKKTARNKRRELVSSAKKTRRSDRLTVKKAALKEASAAAAAEGGGEA